MSCRLQKFLAEAGVASRRAAEGLITDGRVAVNGRTVRELGTKVDPLADRVAVDGRPVKARRKLYLALNKPKGCVCSRHDEHGRPTIYELLPPEWTNLYSVGRLDYATEGLIFLTNDGEFALRLTHPRYAVRKQYLATVEGRIPEAALGRFCRGVFSQGEELKAEKARLLASSSTRSIVELELAEGKNREVRRLLEAVGLKALKLVRTRIGPCTLEGLQVGQARNLLQSELKALWGRDNLRF